MIGIVYSGRINKNFYVNVIEFCVYFNLIVLSTLTLAGLNSTVLVYLLVSHMYLRYHDMIAICIFQFHVFYIAKIALWIKLKGMWPSYKEASKNDGDNVADFCKGSLGLSLRLLTGRAVPKPSSWGKISLPVLFIK